MNTNKRVIRVLIVVSSLFLALVSYLLYFNMFRAQTVVTNPYNQRQWEEETFVVRGKIYDAEGVVLAETVEEDDGSIMRVYPQKNMYSHVIGYCSRVYGKSLLEQKYDRELLGKDDIGIFQGDKRKGFDLNLTISNDLQKCAYKKMSGKKGALVAMNPKTGEILAMVSLPDFDPNANVLEENWGEIVEREDAPLVSRSIQGLYPPGSTYKIVTAAAAYENNKKDKEFDDIGKFIKGKITVENYNKKSYGKIDVGRAFAVSSNQVFCELGYDLGGETMLDISKRFGIDEKIESDFDIAKSRIEYKKMTDTDAALVAIGQGQLLTTPVEMALICSAVANGGKIMRPYIVDTVTKNNVIIQSSKPKEIMRAISPECAKYLGELMLEVVESGTGTKAKINGVSVAGKTGTAENESDKDHSWFVGFAPYEDPQIAVAVILENDGTSGGDSAAPIAKSVISEYLLN